MMRLCWAVIVGVALLAGGAAAQETPKNLLMLDTGGHMAPIRSIAFTPDGQQLISVSDDKTIRVWDLATARTVRTMRGESAPGHTGKIFAIALSSDGKWLAVGGWMTIAGEGGDHIRLYDFASGRLVALLKGHEDVVLGLAFSPDGRHLISGSGDKTAIIWDTGSLSGASPGSGSRPSVEQRPLRHRLTGHTDEIYAVGFTPDGARAVTGSEDNDLRLWSVADGKEIGHMLGHGDKVSALAVARDGTIASGDNSGEIRIWDGGTGALRKVLVRQGAFVGNLSFSPDGKTLLSGNGAAHGPWPLHVYDLASGREIVSYSGHDNVVMATAVSPDGRWAATGGGDGFPIHLWDLRTGERRLGPDGQPLTLGGQGQQVWAAGFAVDGRSIAWGNAWQQNDPAGGYGPIQYMVALPSAEDALPRPRGLDRAGVGTFRRPLASHGAWSLQHRKGGNRGLDAILDVARDGKIVASIERGSTNGNRHRAYSLTPDGETIISGGSWGVLTAYDRQGKRLGDFIGHEGDVWAVAPSPDGRFLVSGSADHTLRLWNLKTRELLITLFHGADGEWVMWTPEGFYIASENGGKLVGWQINQGPEKEARYVTADQVRRLFNRPDLVAAKIEGDPEGKLREEAERLDIDAILASGAAPEVSIVTPSDNWEAADNSVTVTIRVADAGGGIGRIGFRVNGQSKEGEGANSGFGAMALDERGELKRTFELARTENLIEVIATNGANFVASLPARVTVKVDERTLKGVPDLYVLAAGVDQYFDSKLVLKYAVNDADTLSTALEAAAKSQGGQSFYRNVHVTRLANAQVTRANLEAAFTEIGKKARATDVFVFFIAGHGKSDNGTYYFLPPDFKNAGFKPLETQGISTVSWDAWAAKVKAEKSLLIYDTCESGTLAGGDPKLASVGRNAEQMAAYERMRKSTGRMTLSAAGKAGLALEGYRGRHGLLTYAILEAFARGDGDHNDEIALLELFNYVVRRVPELSCEMEPARAGAGCYRQVPQAAMNDLNASFPLLPKFAAADPDLILAHGEAGAVSLIGQSVPNGPPTHFLKEAANLLDAPHGKTLRSLTKNFSVTEISAEGGFALIARNGQIIGYLDESKLERLE